MASSKVVVHSAATLPPPYPISCYALLGQLYKIRQEMGLAVQESAAQSAPATTASSLTPAVPLLPSETYWAAVTALGWVTVDDRVLTHDDVDDGIEAIEDLMPLEDFVAWLDWMAADSRKRCPDLERWTENDIYNLILVGRDVYESAIAIPEIRTYNASVCQPGVNIAEYLASSVAPAAPSVPPALAAAMAAATAATAACASGGNFKDTDADDYDRAAAADVDSDADDE